MVRSLQRECDDKALLTPHRGLLCSLVQSYNESDIGTLQTPFQACSFCCVLNFVYLLHPSHSTPPPPLQMSLIYFLIYLTFIEPGSPLRFKSLLFEADLAKIAHRTCTLIGCNFPFSSLFSSLCPSLWQSAVGHDYQSKLSKHCSQTDTSKGFGGKFGVQADRVDQVGSAPCCCFALVKIDVALSPQHLETF